MNKPLLIGEESFQLAWIEAIRFLKNNNWESRNLITHISKPMTFDSKLHEKIELLSTSLGLLGSKHVAYTIFPHNQYDGRGTADKLYSRYNDRFYKWLKKRAPAGWGTYFRRMTRYDTNKGNINQLENIIKAINTRTATHKAAYTITIQKPGGETIRPRGAPCLNYIAVQLEPGDPRTLNLLSIYRNHDFLKRAYGNYWGLCNLLNFLAKETKSKRGCLTNISSHAYVPRARTKLTQFLENL